MSDALLQIRGLEKWYGKLQVFSGVDLDIHQGEVVSIIGSSGSGKTTLLRCVNLLEQFQHGTIHLNGEEMGYRTVGGKRTRLPESQIASQRIHTGMVFQQFNLFPHMTALKNVTLGLRKVKHMDKEAAEKEALKWLKRVGLADKVDAYPSQLSGGQQQRVAIARALVTRPAVILADEATGNLDTRSSTEILQIFQRLNQEQGITIVFVTHDPWTARHTRRLVMVRDGVVVADQPVSTPLVAGESERPSEAEALDAVFQQTQIGGHGAAYSQGAS